MEATVRRGGVSSKIPILLLLQRQGSDQAQGGYAAVDALVALVILAVGLTLSLSAAATARKIATTAAQTRRAEALGRFLLAQPALAPGERSGLTDDLNWRVQASPLEGAAGPGEVRLCQLKAVIRPQRTRRVFALDTVAPC